MRAHFAHVASIVWLFWSAVCAGAEPEKRVWNFENETPEEIAAGFSEEDGQWRVVESEGGKALAQQAKNADETFNVCLAKDASVQDLVLSVRFKAIAGELDQGGGIVWRARDAHNYYIARY